MRKVPFVLVLLFASCAADGEPWSGENLDGMKLALHTANEGVHPDQSVLTDPSNPFAHSSLGQDTIWQVQARGGAVAGFYAWATACARGATGERQYYAALDLEAVYEQSMANPNDMEAIRLRAIRGFQTVLDTFPNDVTYAADGVTTYDLATPSVQGILSLGGKVLGGWVLVTTDNGGKMAVRR